MDPTLTEKKFQESLNMKILHDWTVDDCIRFLKMDNMAVHRLKEAIDEEKFYAIELALTDNLIDGGTKLPRNFVRPSEIIMDLLKIMRTIITELEPNFESILEDLNNNVPEELFETVVSRHLKHYERCLGILKFLKVETQKLTYSRQKQENDRTPSKNQDLLAFSKMFG